MFINTWLTQQKAVKKEQKNNEERGQTDIK